MPGVSCPFFSSRCASRALPWVQSVHGIERGDRGVRARADLEPPGHQRDERVHASSPPLSEALFVHPSWVAPFGVERRLHGDRQSQSRGPFDLAGRGQLEVLDPVPAGPKVPALSRVEGAVHALPHRERLFDGPVADGVDGGLQSGEVGVVEELGQLVVLPVEHARVDLRLVRLRHLRRPGPDGSIQREVTPDGLEPEVHDVGDVGVGHVDHHVDGETMPVLQQDLDVAPAPGLGDGHLVDAGHTPGRRRSRRLELELPDLVLVERLVEPPLDVLVRLSPDHPRGLARGVSLDPVLPESVRLVQGGRVRQRDVAVGPNQDHGRVAQLVEIRESRERRVGPMRLVEPVGQDPAGLMGQLLRHEPEHLLGRACPLDRDADAREGRARQMDVGVDESRDDRGPGELHHPIRVGRLAGADPLDVPVVEQEPLPHRAVAERVDPRGPIERLQRQAPGRKRPEADGSALLMAAPV